MGIFITPKTKLGLCIYQNMQLKVLSISRALAQLFIMCQFSFYFYFLIILLLVLKILSNSNVVVRDSRGEFFAGLSKRVGGVTYLEIAELLKGYEALQLVL